MYVTNKIAQDVILYNKATYLSIYCATLRNSKQPRPIGKVGFYIFIYDPLWQFLIISLQIV